MSARILDKRLAELKKQLSFAKYKCAGMYPHPHWFEDVERLTKEISLLERKINGKRRTN